MSVAQGLAELHAQHIIVCDLKPANILLTDTGHAVISDFGISHCVSTTVGGVQMTHCAGTYNYMAPDQMIGAEGEGGGVTPKTDMWAFACTLIHMLTGKAPMEGRNPLQILMQVRKSSTFQSRLTGKGP